MDIFSPLWDSVEALFFVIAGFITGIAFGVLFPSLWRTWRRRFYNKRFRYRRFFQNPLPSDGVKTCLEVLTDEQSSNEQIFQALLDLTQTYVTLELWDQALETCRELVFKHPDNLRTWRSFAHLLHVLPESFFLHHEKKIHPLLQSCLVSPQTQDCHMIANRCFHSVESYISRQRWQEAREWAQLGLLWWPQSAKGRLVLWHLMVQEYWQNPVDSKNGMWHLCLTLAGDLHAFFQILSHTSLEPKNAVPWLLMLLKQVADHSGPAILQEIAARSETWNALLGVSDSNLHSVIKQVFLDSFIATASTPYDLPTGLMLRHFLQDISRLICRQMPELWAIRREGLAFWDMDTHVLKSVLPAWEYAESVTN